MHIDHHAAGLGPLYALIGLASAAIVAVVAMTATDSTYEITCCRGLTRRVLSSVDGDCWERPSVTQAVSPDTLTVTITFNRKEERK